MDAARCFALHIFFGHSGVPHPLLNVWKFWSKLIAEDIHLVLEFRKCIFGLLRVLFSGGNFLLQALLHLAFALQSSGCLGLEETWAARTPTQAIEVLGQPDVVVTNASDKHIQLKKLAALDERLRAAPQA